MTRGIRRTYQASADFFQLLSPNGDSVDKGKTGGKIVDRNAPTFSAELVESARILMKDPTNPVALLSLSFATGQSVDDIREKMNCFAHLCEPETIDDSRVGEFDVRLRDAAYQSNPAVRNLFPERSHAERDMSGKQRAERAKSEFRSLKRIVDARETVKPREANIPDNSTGGEFVNRMIPAVTINVSAKREFLAELESPAIQIEPIRRLTNYVSTARYYLTSKRLGAEYKGVAPSAVTGKPDWKIPNVRGVASIRDYAIDCRSQALLAANTVRFADWHAYVTPFVLPQGELC